MWILRTDDDGEGKALVFRIPSGRVRTIGRVGNADFVVEDTLVSRVHCRLAASMDGALHLEDLDSTNGTFVNGERITKAILTPSDRLRVGSLELVVAEEQGS
jgi:pSer/pThr/pTyr-binding forkhead associated (FHA) protein